MANSLQMAPVKSSGLPGHSLVVLGLATAASLLVLIATACHLGVGLASWEQVDDDVFREHALTVRQCQQHRLAEAVGVLQSLSSGYATEAEVFFGSGGSPTLHEQPAARLHEQTAARLLQVQASSLAPLGMAVLLALAGKGSGTNKD